MWNGGRVISFLPRSHRSLRVCIHALTCIYVIHVSWCICLSSVAVCASSEVGSVKGTSPRDVPHIFLTLSLISLPLMPTAIPKPPLSLFPKPLPMAILKHLRCQFLSFLALHPWVSATFSQMVATPHGEGSDTTLHPLGFPGWSVPLGTGGKELPPWLVVGFPPGYWKPNQSYHLYHSFLSESPCSNQTSAIAPSHFDTLLSRINTQPWQAKEKYAPLPCPCGNLSDTVLLQDCKEYRT